MDTVRSFFIVSEVDNEVLLVLQTLLNDVSQHKCLFSA